MHEISYIIDIVNTITTKMEQDGIKKVNKIVVDVGEMSGVIPYYLHKYYPDVVKNTQLEHAQLITNDIKVEIECEECKTIYHPEKIYSYKCPKCGERKGNLIRGKGIQIKNIEIEE